MTAPKIINNKQPGDRPYMAGLHGQRAALYAPSLYAAKQRAFEHFKPKKKDLGLLWVELASKED